MIPAQRQAQWKVIFFWVCLAFAVFQLYTAGFGFLPDMRQRAVHITFGLLLSLLAYSIKRRTGKAETMVPLYDLFLIGIVLAANVSIFLVYELIFLPPGGQATTRDLVLGVLLSLVVLETTRRVLGWVIPIMVGAALLYVFVGPYIPGIWGFRAIPIRDVIQSLYYSADGIYGSLTGISATLLGVFIVFGDLLLFSGAGKTFTDLALKMTGRFRGGPAKAAVVASAMFGTLSGSPIANAAMVGVYTIPLMKGLGYRPEFAGGVEATASTGGVITPPIMGVGAFIMSQLLGISYVQIMFYALIPCFLFYVCVFTGVHCEAVRSNLTRTPAVQIPSSCQAPRL